MGHHHKHDHHGNPKDVGEYIQKLEDPSRDEWQKPHDVIRALQLPPNAVVAEIGPGPGYFSLKLAKAAAWVYAVEVSPGLIEVLRQRIETSGVRNVTPVFALQDDPLLPDASCDVVLMADAYHHFPDGPAYLRRLARSLKDGGRIANIDYHAGDLPVGPDDLRKIPREHFLRDAEAAGLTVVSEEKFLPYQYFLLLRP